MKDQPLVKDIQVRYYESHRHPKKRNYGWLISLGVVLLAVALFILLVWYAQ